MGKDKRKRDELNRLERIKKTCTVVLEEIGVRRYPIGDFTLEEPDPGPTIDQFADEAFKSARASLSKLRVPSYRIVVIDGQREQGYGLDRWIKLVDRSNENSEEHARKQRIRRGKLAA